MPSDDSDHAVPANLNEKHHRYWTELRETMVRGVGDPTSLKPEEIARVCGIALLSFDAAMKGLDGRLQDGDRLAGWIVDEPDT